MRTRAYRRHQAWRHMWRRLSEDRNQHYGNLSCSCWHDPKAMARFKEQPQHCSCWLCGNPRRVAKADERRTIQEHRAWAVEDYKFDEGDAAT